MLEVVESEMQFLRDRLAQLGQIRNRLKREIIATETPNPMSGYSPVGAFKPVDAKLKQGV